MRVVAAVIKPRRGRPRAPRLASRGGMGGCGLGLDRPPPPRHSATLRFGAVACDATGACLPGWPCCCCCGCPCPCECAYSLLQRPPQPHPTPPRAGPVCRLVSSSHPRCGAVPLPPPRLAARSLARVLPNRKASRKNNRQSPKEIGREREKRRRDARGGEEEKAEGEKKKKKNPRPPPAAPPRAAHTDGRTDGRTSPPSAAGFSQ